MSSSSSPPPQAPGSLEDTSSSSVADQRRVQSTWRPWNKMLDTIQNHINNANNNDGIINALDLGCGTGEVVHLMHQRGYNIIGIDQDDDMLDAARSKYPLLEFQKHDIQNPPFFQKKFDLIWSSFAVQYFVKEFRESVLDRWIKLLSPDGLLAIVETNGLFAVHEPQANQGCRAFEEMELALNNDMGYDTRAADQLPRILQDHNELDLVENSEWSDDEFAFEGPARSDIIVAWRERLERMKFPKEYFSKEFEDRTRAFLECLKSPQHTTKTKIRLIVARKSVEL